MRAIGIFLIQAYQVVLGPLLGGNCRFSPSCSNYGIEALMRHGFFKGGWLTVRRILRCHPFGAHGYDPVPEKWPGFFVKVYVPPKESTIQQDMTPGDTLVATISPQNGGDCAR